MDQTELMRIAVLLNWMKRILVNYLLCCIFVLLTSCGKEKQSDFEGITFSKSVVALHHSGFNLNNISLFNKVVGPDSLLILDGSSNQFVLYNLDSKKIVLTIPVVKEGPNFFDSVLHDAEIESNQLHVVSGSYYSIYDMNGVNNFRIRLDEMFPSDELFFSTDIHLQSQNRMLFNRVPLSMATGINFNLIPNEDIFFSFNLEDKALENYGVKPPEEIRLRNENAGYFQHLAINSITSNKDSILYTYPFSSKVYGYDIRNRKSFKKDLNSTYVQNEREAFPANLVASTKWIDYANSGSQFSALAKDDKTNLYARVVSEFKENKNGKKYNAKFLMIFNSNLDLIEEFEIQERILEPALFTNGKIYLKKTDQDVEDEYQFVVYTVDINN